MKGMCQNGPVPTLDAGSHENRPYKQLIDKACSFAAPRQARGQGTFDTPPCLTIVWSYFFLSQIIGVFSFFRYISTCF